MSYISFQPKKTRYATIYPCSMIVKLQYKNFEPGEFTEIRDRSFSETIGVIGAFRWEAQRDQLRVGLTTPSVTVESPTGEFLKLALYYSGKFVLYYIDCRHHEFRLVLTAYGDAAESIRAFFQNSSAPPDGFISQQTLWQKVMVHFRTGDFTYKTTLATAASMIGLLCLFLIVPAVFNASILASGKHTLWPLLIPALGFLIFGTAQTLLLVNHYRSAKGKVLILSRGLQGFAYGPVADPRRFNKQDIAEIITHGMRGRGGYPVTTRVEIYFKDGQSINISCLIISQETLVSKFPDCPQTRDKILFPFIPLSSSSPS